MFIIISGTVTPITPQAAIKSLLSVAVVLKSNSTGVLPTLFILVQSLAKDLILHTAKKTVSTLEKSERKQKQENTDVVGKQKPVC